MGSSNAIVSPGFPGKVDGASCGGLISWVSWQGDPVQ